MKMTSQALSTSNIKASFSISTTSSSAGGGSLEVDWTHCVIKAWPVLVSAARTSRAFCSRHCRVLGAVPQYFPLFLLPPLATCSSSAATAAIWAWCKNCVNEASVASPVSPLSLRITMSSSEQTDEAEPQLSRSRKPLELKKGGCVSSMGVVSWMGMWLGSGTGGGGGVAWLG